MYNETNSKVNVYGSFNDYDLATKAVAALMDHGISESQITIMMKGDAHRNLNGSGVPVIEQAATGLTATTAADATNGAAKGAGVGLGVGLIAGLSAIMLPGIGLVVGGGAMVAALGGAIGAGAAGALAGAVTGYLVDQGATEESASEVAGILDQGKIVVGVSVDDSETADVARKTLAKYKDTQPTWFEPGLEPAVADGELALPLQGTPSPAGDVVTGSREPIL